MTRRAAAVALSQVTPRQLHGVSSRSFQVARDPSGSERLRLTCCRKRPSWLRDTTVGGERRRKRRRKRSGNIERGRDLAELCGGSVGFLYMRWGGAYG